jgi:hypothetical protein
VPDKELFSSRLKFSLCAFARTNRFTLEAQRENLRREGDEPIVASVESFVARATDKCFLDRARRLQGRKENNESQERSDTPCAAPTGSKDSKPE